jgi:hypothetical protein
MIDILICSVPGTFSDRPALAPAVLKASVQEYGYTAVALDLNIEVYNAVKKSSNRVMLENFFLRQEISPQTSTEIGDLIEYCIQRIVSYKPRVLALSLLTQDNQFFAIWLCWYVKIQHPELHIVIGGSGIKNFIAESNISFAQLLYDKSLIDGYINGDGECSLVEYLKDNRDFPGINHSDWEPVQDLNAIPFADFDDYTFSNYKEPGIPICDSRGCVRSCEFCDIIEHWKKYQYRRAEHIFEEMQHQIQKHNIKRFFFYNSLTNGNMKEFRKLLEMISDYNSRCPEQTISWDGYFIVRNSKQHPDELWQLIKRSNGSLQLGIESVVEPVRVSLGKNFTNPDIDYHLEMAKKYQIPLLLLLIVGYPTETKQDFEYTKQWFRDRKDFAGDPVTQVVFSLAAILPNTKLDRKSTEYGITKGEIPTIWMQQSISVTLQDRLQYHNELGQLLQDLRFSVSDGGKSVEVFQAEIS